MSHRFLLLAFVLALGTQAPVSAAPIEIASVKHDGDVHFEKEILPIFRKNCLACHNRTDAESDLVMETPQTILKGGSEGPAVVAGKSADSLLLKLAAHQKEPVMPPKKNDVGAKPLTPQELGLIKLWIDQGAKGEVTMQNTQITWQPLPPGVNPVYAVSVSRDGQFAAAGRANQVFMYHVPSKRELGRLDDADVLKSGLYKNPGVAHLDLVQSLAFSPTADLLASGSFREVKLWRRQANVKKLEIAGLDAAKSVAVSADGKWLAFGEDKGGIKLVDAAGKPVHTFAGHSATVSGLAFNADGSQLLSGSQDKTFRLWSVADKKQLVSVETPAPVNAVAFVAEGKQIATAGADNLIRLWATITEQPAEAPKPANELKGHTGPVTSLAALPAGAELVSGSQDGTLRTWTVATGAAGKNLNHGGPIVSVAVRADGQRYASAGGTSVKLWNAAATQAVADLKGDYRARLQVDESTRTVALAKRHVELAKADLKAATDRKTAEEKNVTQSEEALKKAAEEMGKKVEAAKKPAEDKAAGEKKLAEVKEAFTKAEAEKKKADEAVTKADEALKKAQEDLKNAGEDAAKKEAATKAVADAEAAKKPVDDAKKKAEADFKTAETNVKNEEANFKKVADPAQKALDEKSSAERAHQAAQRSVDRAKESVTKAAAEITVQEQNVKTTEEGVKTTEAGLATVTTAATATEKPLRAVAFSPDGATVGAVGEGQIAFTWSSENGTAVDRFEGQGAVLALVAFTADNHLLAVGENNSAVVWDASGAWKLERKIGAPDNEKDLVDRVLALGFSWDGKWLATGSGEPSRSGQLKIWNVADGTLVKEIKDAHSDTIFSLEFSRDNKFIASSAADRFMKVFDVGAAKFVRSFEGHTHHVLGVTWSADGRTLVSSGADKVIKIWDARTGDQKKTSPAFGKEVSSVRFVGDTLNVVAASGDKTVRMKETNNGGDVRSFQGGTDFMYCADSSADGKVIVGGGQDSMVRVWDAANGTVMATFAPPQAVAANK